MTVRDAHLRFFCRAEQNMVMAEYARRWTAADRVTKRKFFQRVGVPEYWVVELDARTVERWHPADDAPEMLRDQLEWRPAGSHTPMLLELAAFFANVSGDD
jgi:Uma2 family endonuclease